MNSCFQCFPHLRCAWLLVPTTFFIISSVLCVRYEQGTLQAKLGDPKAAQQVESAAKQMLAGQYSSDLMESQQVDELLEWTRSLNFDDYCLDWSHIATSDISEAPVCKCKHSESIFLF